ncbi:alpha-amylase [Corallococcus sp. H22C18031201]|nr:alpha-amylase [Corallococcus sp. H22C18031201]
MRFPRSVSLLAAALLSACANTAPNPEPQPLSPSASLTLMPPAGGAWHRGAVFYEVFVRSFQDSNGDGVGDLPGLTSRLDYLRDLGVDALWLMPVFASPSYHGYDVTDYERIQPDYGTLADFQTLCDEAHRRGLRVILDLVINHTSAQHPWFVDSAASPTAAHRDWYVWRDRNLGWNQPWSPYASDPTWHPLNGAYFYGVFWSGMPDLNLATPAVRDEVKRLASLWLSRGADGFRLDAARYLIETGGGPGQSDTPQTHAFWKEFAAHVHAVKPDAVLVGENWSDTPVIATYYGDTAQVPGGDELSLNFNFPLSERLIAALGSGDASGIAGKLVDMTARYPAGVADAPFLTNHDMVRLATQLQGDSVKLGTAAALLLTLPGAPFLYYGEEVGLANGAGNNDEAKRTPMPWDTSTGGGFTTGTPWYGFSTGRETANVAAQRGVTSSLLSRYQALLRARHASAALTAGGLTLLTPPNGASPTLAYVRFSGEEQVLVVHNLSGALVTSGPFAVPGDTAEPLFTDRDVPVPTGGSGNWRVRLPAHSTGIWRLR